MESFADALSKGIATFAAQLGSSKIGTLVQVWVPEPSDDGAIVLRTQGMPFCLNGTGDLLALFRCISCKYKFSTDTMKPWLMGPVGRVYTTGEPELTQNVQLYDEAVYCRVLEAQRCQVHSCLFLPVYGTSARDHVVAVMEVVQTEENPLFQALVDWARMCLEGVGLWTTDSDKDSLPVGLRKIKTVFEGSALESKAEPRPLASIAATRHGMAAPLAPWSNPGVYPVDQSLPSHTYSFGSVQVANGGGLTNHNIHGLHVLDNNAQNTFGRAGNDARPEAAADRGGIQSRGSLPPLPQGKIVQVGKSLVLETDAVKFDSTCSIGTEPEDRRKRLKSIGNGISLDRRALSLPLEPLSHGIDEKPLGVSVRVATAPGDCVMTLQDLAPYFKLSLKKAAEQLGICETTLKKVCRKLGINRWPRRDLSDPARNGARSGSRSETISGGGSDEQKVRNPLHDANLVDGPERHVLGGAASQFTGSAGDPSHGMESLDILAAVDLEFSVGNSPQHPKEHTFGNNNSIFGDIAF